MKDKIKGNNNRHEWKKNKRNCKEGNIANRKKKKEL